MDIELSIIDNSIYIIENIISNNIYHNGFKIKLSNSIISIIEYIYNIKIKGKYEINFNNTLDIIKYLYNTGITYNNVNYKIKGYGKINTIRCLKNVLFNYGPCLIVLPCYYEKDNFWIPVFKGQTINKFVLLFVIGYDINGFILKDINSSNKYNYNYIDFGYHYELWGIFDNESLFNDSYEIKKRKKKFSIF